MEKRPTLEELKKQLKELDAFIERYENSQVSDRRSYMIRQENLESLREDRERLEYRIKNFNK